MKLISLLCLVILSSGLVAAPRTADTLKVIPVLTIAQTEIRPSYPFPDFLSTGPSVWYENVTKQPLKGHTYRIATFYEHQSYKIYVEKVDFGDGGCCLEIVEYRELVINEKFLGKHFPKNTGKHGFKLVRWLKAEIFEFDAFGGRYKLSEIGQKEPLLEELLLEK